MVGADGDYPDSWLTPKKTDSPAIRWRKRAVPKLVDTISELMSRGEIVAAKQKAKILNRFLSQIQKGKVREAP